MTADERIEGLLNSFGQTISDLPKPKASRHAYIREHLGSANLAACRWHGKRSLGASLNCEDYICHLCDVIDRMETALETAVRWSPCDTCIRFEKEWPKCKGKYDTECYEMNDACFIDNDVEVDDENS